MKWQQRFIKLAKEVASWSKEGKRVGCIIVDMDTNKVLATGYNGLPAYMNDNTLPYLSKDDKSYLVTHAEDNALQQLSREHYHKNLAMYVTKPPCRLCSIRIVESLANIQKIYYIPSASVTFNDRYRVSESLSYLNASGVQMVEIQHKEDRSLEVAVIKYLDDPEFLKCIPLLENILKEIDFEEAMQKHEEILAFYEQEGSVSAGAFFEWYDTRGEL